MYEFGDLVIEAVYMSPLEVLIILGHVGIIVFGLGLFMTEEWSWALCITAFVLLFSGGVISHMSYDEYVITLNPSDTGKILPIEYANECEVTKLVDGRIEIRTDDKSTASFIQYYFTSEIE